jgi:hypothetical protein
MGEFRRLTLLKRCLAEYQRLLESVTVRLPAAGAERPALLAQRSLLARKVEHAQIEILLVEDADALVALYTHPHAMADAHASSASRADSRRAFRARARFCEEVAREALERRGTIESIPAVVLAVVEADLERAAGERQPTLASVDRALDFVNGALDTLLVLVPVAERLAA